MTNSNSLSTILFLGSDPSWMQEISLELQRLGYVAAVESNLDRARAQIQSLDLVAIVIRYRSMKEAGIEFCRQLRASGSRQTILMLLSEGTVDERVICLDAGADDYLIEPVRGEDLLQMLRSYLQTVEVNEERLRFGDLVLDLSTHKILRQNRTIELTTKEFDLLRYLMLNPNKVLSREDILENVWGYDYRGESNVIEVYIRYLRLKLEAEGHKRSIQTVRGVGYVLRE